MASGDVIFEIIGSLISSRVNTQDIRGSGTGTTQIESDFNFGGGITLPDGSSLSAIVLKFTRANSDGNDVNPDVPLSPYRYVNGEPTPRYDIIIKEH